MGLGGWVAAGILALGAAGASPAAESDHAPRLHRVVRITENRLHPETIEVRSSEAVAWLNYAGTALRISFDASTARALRCRAPTSFSIAGERLVSGDLRPRGFASFCRIAPGRYPYRVEVLDAGGVASVLAGELAVVE